MPKIKEGLRKQMRWIILLLGLILFFEILEDVFENEIYQFDSTVYQLVSHTISDTFTNMVKVVTNMGSAPVILVIMILAMILVHDRKINVCILLNLVIITILNQGLKRMIARPRPVEHRLINESGYSFPSGHSMVSMAFYGFLIYLAYQKIQNPYLRAGVCIFLNILIVLIGMSRIYLGVHYPSDVLAGFCISLSYLALFTNITKKQIKKGEEV